jgi:hypothetical protein
MVFPSQQNAKKNSESLSNLQESDDLFPETLKLMRNGDPEFQKAMELHDKLQPAGLQFAYRGLNKTTTEEENWKDMKISINLWMNWIQHYQQQKQDGDGFRLGKDFTGIGAVMIPALERWRYQPLIMENFDTLKDLKHLQYWFDTINSFEPRASRVAGDKYSWTGTNVAVNAAASNLVNNRLATMPKMRNGNMS